MESQRVKSLGVCVYRLIVIDRVRWDFENDAGRNDLSVRQSDGLQYLALEGS